MGGRKQETDLLLFYLLEITESHNALLNLFKYPIDRCFINVNMITGMYIPGDEYRKQKAKNRKKHIQKSI